MQFYRDHARDLPWREAQPSGTSCAWAVWVSEVMLQQTRVDVVIAHYIRFMERFPTPANFAAVDDEGLLEAWRGLGYYRRARLLREGARKVVADHGGEVPGDPTTLAALPGVGRYTQGAIGAIVFGLPLPAIDGNVERVVSRHRGIEDDPKKAIGARAVRETVEDWLDHEDPGSFAQALMELGATVCTPRNPKCSACPIAADCVARTTGRQHDLPKLAPRKAAVPVQARCVLVPCAGGVLARRIPQGEVNAGQLELPGPGMLVQVDDADQLAATLLTSSNASLTIAEPLATIRHGITNHRITCTVHTGKLTGSLGSLSAADPNDPALPWSTPSRKLFAALDQLPEIQGESRV